jgi:uncharacterized protein (DUF952 family)
MVLYVTIELKALLEQSRWEIAKISTILSHIYQPQNNMEPQA